MNQKIIITIDGHSSTGKSTTAKEVARQLHYIYVDTGAMYRAITLYAVQQNCVTNDGQIDVDRLVSLLGEAELAFRFDEKLGYAAIFLNGINVEKEIRSMEISSKVSEIAKIEAVRAKLVNLQQQMGEQKGIVMDGRDIGTVVFPQAELKIFMTAPAQVRAQRRYDELIAKGDKVSYEEVFQNITHRDLLDTTREVSPLKKAIDAIEIDNSNLTISGQVAKIVELAEKIISRK